MSTTKKTKASHGRARRPAPKIHSGAKRKPTSRFERKREDVITAATNVLTLKGLKGFTLAEVAERTGLITQGVSYYFKKKDDLAAACILRTLHTLNDIASHARKPKTPAERFTSFLDRYMETLGSMRRGEIPPLAPLDEVRALKPESLNEVLPEVTKLYRQIRAMLDDESLSWMTLRMRSARSLLFMQLALSVPAWESSIYPEDYMRSCERMTDIILGGLAIKSGTWDPHSLQLPRSEEAQLESFLRVATQLINEKGYRSASVDEIASRLDVTKGAFYHYHETKDEVVLRCFERTLSIVRAIQFEALRVSTNEWRRLVSVCSALAEFQASDQGPLLRTTAIYALPKSATPRFSLEMSQMSRRIGAIISDGIAEGSIRAVDALIAGELAMAAINSSVELKSWIRNVEVEEMADLYVRPLLTGLLNP